MLASGGQGGADQARMVEAFDGEVVAHYAVSGRYDVVLIADFPDEDTCMAFALAASAAGQYAEPLPARRPEEFRAREIIVKAAQKLAESDGNETEPSAPDAEGA
jgi:uncharacterized protein with GYD domain